MSLDPSSLLLLTFLSAVTFHEFVLRNLEVDHLVVPIISLSSIAFWYLVYRDGFAVASLVVTAFVVSLLIWIVLYRTLWHPLRSFPGPFGAKVSKWWAVKQVWNTESRWYRVQQQLQRRYGDYVRTGPREITIFDPAAIQPIQGFSSKATRGPFHDILETSLYLNRNKGFHRQRRKIWDNAMKMSLSEFAPRIEEFTDQLLIRLQEAKGNPVPLTDYFHCYSYDIMADLAFGKPVGFTRGESNDVSKRILAITNRSLEAVGLMYHVPWLMKALGTVLSLAGPMKEWSDWSMQQINSRIADEDAKPDLVMHLMNKTPKNRPGLSLLHGDSRLIITAGSETISSALTFIFIQLGLHPKYLHAVRQEFRDNQAAYHCQRPLPLLDAVIHETMRVWPSVFLGPQHVTPPNGLTINENYIPGNTIVQMMPAFAVNHDERNYVYPDEFVPERWTTQPELVLKKSAFNPFSTGPYSCVGKRLAMMELRSVVGRVINEFDISLPGDFDSCAFYDGVKDYLSAAPPRQLVRFIRVG